MALLGLSFKPGTDDVRFSPSLALARRLLSEAADVVGYDPRAGANAKTEVPELQIAPSICDALEGAHCVVVCTGWDEFRDLDLLEARNLMAYPTMVDGRNLFDPGAVRDAGFRYVGTARAVAHGVA